VTCYGLDGPGIESRRRARFSAPIQTSPGAHPASYTMGTGSFLGVKRPGRDVDHPPPSSAEVKEGVELYLFSPSGPSWSVLGCTLPLPFILENSVYCFNMSNFSNYFYMTSLSFCAIIWPVALCGSRSVTVTVFKNGVLCVEDI
jgi:hypothetical protein